MVVFLFVEVEHRIALAAQSRFSRSNATLMMSLCRAPCRPTQEFFSKELQDRRRHWLETAANRSVITVLALDSNRLDHPSPAR
jgi:hypothetical protein